MRSTIALVILTVLAVGANGQRGAAEDPQSREKIVRRAFDEVSAGMHYSWTEKWLAGLGDGAAPEIMKCIGSKPLRRKDTETALSLVRMSFARDSFHRRDVNGIPTNTLVLLDYLNAHTSDADSETKSTIHTMQKQFGEINTAIDDLLAKLAVTPGTATGSTGQRVPPFLACVPSDRAVLSFTITDPSDPPANAVVRVSARNLTDQMLAVALTPFPAGVFSLTVLNSAGGNTTTIEPSPDWLRLFNYPVYVVLPPGALVPLWNWDFANDFDVLSAPGMYGVSLGGRIPYLNTVACSNSVNVLVRVSGTN